MASTDADDVFQTQRLTANQARRTYLVTYSQADLEKVPTRERFADLVVDAFLEGGEKQKAKPLHWACCQEEHADGGKHYHLCIKLSQPKRWKTVKSHVAVYHKIILHFSSAHDNYYSAYKYVTKSDKNVYHSKDHPNLADAGSPKTKNCIKAFRQKSSKSKSEKPECPKPKKPRRLSNLDVHEILLENQIKKKDELLALGKEQYVEGKKDLLSFVLSRNSKNIEDLIANTWQIEASRSIVERRNMSRMQLIEAAAQGNCEEGCNGEWMQCAYEVVTNNKVHPYVFADSVRNLLEKGRGKNRNILIVGPSSCGKTFLLRPLQKIFNTFSNPSIDKYAWVGADKSECIFLNDFRFSHELIAWEKLLILLEGDIVKLPAPKNHFASDVCIQSDVPVFATSISPITYIHPQTKATCPGENKMMQERWKIFTFFHEIPEEEQKDVKSCARCFSRFILLGRL